MIAGLKPYAAMKPSGVEWLGDVPDHWGVERLGNLLRERGETNKDGSVAHVLSVLRQRGVIPYNEKGSIGNKKSEDTSRYKVVRPDDIVVNCMNVIIGSVGLSSYTGCLSPVYYVLVTRGNDAPQYLSALFQTPTFHRSLVRIGNGILAHRMRIPMELLKCELLPRPPLPEQAAIVRYLDHVDRRISRYIRAKQRLIELLEEEKQAIIHRAVTRGLDPDVRLKPSGVEWVGEVPEHWRLMPNRTLVRPRKVLVGERHSSYQLLSLTKQGVIVRDVESGVGKFSSDMGTSQEVRVGDLVFCLFDVPETPRTVGLSSHDGMITGAYTVLECLDGVLATYFEFFYRALDDRKLLAPLYSGLRNTIPPARFLSAKTPVPSRIEQAAIVRYVAREFANIDTAIDRARREIGLLGEYRTRLIADVVTGKLNVMEAAAALPEVGPTDLQDIIEIDGAVADELDAELEEVAP